MFNWIEMDVIKMGSVILLIPDLMLPESPLPNGALPVLAFRIIHPFTHVVVPFGFFREKGFDQAPSRGVSVIAGRKRPPTMHMVRQKHPGINGEGIVCANSSDRLTQKLPRLLLIEQGPSPTGDHREEESPSRVFGAAVAGHFNGLDLWGLQRKPFVTIVPPGDGGHKELCPPYAVTKHRLAA